MNREKKKGALEKESLAELRKRILSQGYGGPAKPGTQAQKKPPLPGKKPTGIFGFPGRPGVQAEQPPAPPKPAFAGREKKPLGLKPFIGVKPREKKPKPAKKKKPAAREKAAPEPKPEKKPRPARKAFPARRLALVKPALQVKPPEQAAAKAVSVKKPVPKKPAVPARKALSPKPLGAPKPWWEKKLAPPEEKLAQLEREAVPLGKRPVLWDRKVVQVGAKALKAPAAVPGKWVVPAGKPSAEERISTIKQKIVESERVKREGLFQGAAPALREEEIQRKANFRLYLAVALVVIIAVSSALFFVFMVFFQGPAPDGNGLPPVSETPMPKEMEEALAGSRTADIEKTGIAQPGEQVSLALVSAGDGLEAELFEGIEGLLQVSFELNERGEAVIHGVSGLESGRITVTPAGDYSVQVLDSGGRVLYELPFNAVFVIMSDPPTRVERIKFSFVLPTAEGAASVAIARDRIALAEKEIE